MATTWADALSPTIDRAGSTGDACRRMKITPSRTNNTSTAVNMRLPTIFNMRAPRSSVADPVAEGVASEVGDDDKDGNAHRRHHRYPPGVEQIGETVLAHGADVRSRSRGSESEEGKASNHKHQCPHVKGGGHDGGWDRAG